MIPPLNVLSGIGIGITFLCRCRTTAVGRPTLGSDPILLAILLSIVCIVVSYGIYHHCFRKRQVLSEPFLFIELYQDFHATTDDPAKF